MTTKGGPKPWILFVDNHKSHHSIEVSEICQANEIIMIGLPPNCTRFMQPNDVLFFGALKNAFAAVLRELRCERKLFYLNNENFASVLKLAINRSAKEAVLKSGFKRTGLSPWDRDAPNFNQLHTNEPEKKNCIGDNLDSIDEEIFKKWADQVFFAESGSNPLFDNDPVDIDMIPEDSDLTDWSDGPQEQSEYSEDNGFPSIREETPDLDYLDSIEFSERQSIEVQQELPDTFEPSNEPPNLNGSHDESKEYHVSRDPCY